VVPSASCLDLGPTPLGTVNAGFALDSGTFLSFLNKRKINTNAYGGSGVHVNLAKKVRELVPQVSQVPLQMVDWIAW
jgi:hypothetical protein